MRASGTNQPSWVKVNGCPAGMRTTALSAGRTTSLVEQPALLSIVKQTINFHGVTRHHGSIRLFVSLLLLFIRVVLLLRPAPHQAQEQFPDLER